MDKRGRVVWTSEAGQCGQAGQGSVDKWGRAVWTSGAGQCGQCVQSQVQQEKSDILWPTDILVNQIEFENLL